MGVALVDRGVRALAAQLNAYYRVLKGVDPDSVYVRLNSGGSFEVRNSATNAAVLKVTDAGIEGGVGEANIQTGAVTNTKLGPDAVTTDKILNGTIVDADINSGAFIAPSKISGGGTANRVAATNDGINMAMQQVVSAMILDGTIVNADVNTAAAINGTKLADTTTPVAKLIGSTVPNRVVATTDGTNIAMQQVVDAMVAAAANINGTKLADTTTPVAKLIGSTVPNRVVATTDGTNMTMQQVVDAMVSPTAAIAYGKLALANGIVNADVNTAAAIALSKLAPGSAGVLKSNGTTISAGNLIVTGDMGSNTVNGDRLADGTVTSAKLAGGVSIPAGSVTTAEIANNTIQTIDIATGGQINKIGLDYTLSGDVGPTALSAGVWTNVFASQNYTIDDANSLVEVSVRGIVAIATANNGDLAGARLFVQNTTPYGPLGGTFSQNTGGFINALTGVGTITIPNFGAGTYQIQVQVRCTAAATFYCRPSNGYEGIGLTVRERKR